MRPYRLLELLKLGRIEFAGFLFCVMVSGALSLRGSALQSTDIIVLLALAVLTNLWGFAHNDCCDLRIDRRSTKLSGRPLVNRTVSITSAWSMIICCILANLVITILFQNGAWGLFVLLASMILGWLYNKLSKNLPGSDILFAASTALLCFLGALLVAGSEETPWLTWNMVWIVVIIQFIDHIIFNAGATLKDVKNDSASSAVTMATFLGVTVGENNTLYTSGRFRGYIILLKLFSLSVLFVSPFWTGIRFTSLQVLLLAITAAASLYLTIDAMNLKVFDRDEIGRRWVKQEATCKLLVPLLLIQTAGWRWGAFLIVVPLGWFLVCNVVLYRRGVSLQKGF